MAQYSVNILEDFLDQVGYGTQKMTTRQKNVKEEITIISPSFTFFNITYTSTCMSILNNDLLHMSLL